MPDSQQRAVTLIIPTYNRSSALIWCLERVEAQTFRSFEVIIVDDGSTDDTAAQVSQYKTSSSLKIDYMRQENSGPATARNKAVRAARSPICIFIGDDILCEPDFIERHVAFHRRMPELAACGLGLTRWESERQKLTPFMRYFEQIQFAYGKLLSGTRPDWSHFYTSNLSVKTELVRKYPFNELFPKAAMEDVELAYRIHQSEELKIALLPDAVAFHYHPTTLRQACRRNITIGWSAHLFEECWREGSLQRRPVGARWPRACYPSRLFSTS
jgi:glycosyltransferase involved in cell wall biosynthesis